MQSPSAIRAWCSYVEISNILRSLNRSLTTARYRPLLVSSVCKPKQCQCRSLHRNASVRQDNAGTEESSETLGKFKDFLEYTFPISKVTEIDRLPDKYWPQGLEVLVGSKGYLGERSDLSKDLSFVPLLDSKRVNHVQLISAPSQSNSDNAGLVHHKIKSLRSETPVHIAGILRQKRAKKVNESAGLTAGSSTKDNPRSAPSLKDLEILILDVQSLNDLPSDVVVKSGTCFPPEQRYLQIRNDKHLRKAIDLRSEIAYTCRDAFHNLNFTEIETPCLFKSTSEGAREFIVPTRRKGFSYALPQSPQQFKQILMASGIHRYYQIAKCFRDEDLRADRQPEFTQLDVEASFADGLEIMSLTEDVVRKIWFKFLDTTLVSTFPRMTYEQAMSRYGSDKPDLRNPIPPFSNVGYLLPTDLISMITSLSHPTVEIMIVPLECSPNETREFIKNYLDSPDAKPFLDNPDGGPGVFIYDSTKPLQGLSAFGFEAVEELEKKFEPQDGHLIILQARKNLQPTGGSTPLGNMRTAIHHAAVRHPHGYLPSYTWKDFKPVWVIDFPLFSPSNTREPSQGGRAGLASTHHPFTSPKSAQDVDLLFEHPKKAIGDHYDLVINGEEIGGGSRRIHQVKMQEFIFREILKMEDARIAEFSHLLEALKAGCPPHAGIALGFDRLVAMVHSSIIEKKVSLRDVIAFPKSGRGIDEMMKSPGPMSEERLETYHLKLRD